MSSKFLNSFHHSLYVEKFINNDFSKVWRIISDKSNLELFHPFCRKNKVYKWSGRKSIDEIEYLNGSTFKRVFYQWIDYKGYDLVINALGKPNSHVSWRIFNYFGRCKVRITLHPYLFNKNYYYLNALPYFLMVKPLMENYLDSVLQGLKWYAETGQLVVNNQFGRHIWFS